MTTPEVTLRDRFRGCLLAGAIGDALGSSIEFMTLPEIKKRFGKHGLTDYAPAPAYGGVGRVTDDTQMLLFTGEGLLRHKVGGVADVDRSVNYSYLRWLTTQGFSPKFAGIPTNGWLLEQKELHARRSPGRTCIEALRAKESLDDLYAGNSSKGSGGVMRAAPAGLVFSTDCLDENIPKAYDLGGRVSRLTHGHPTSTAASGVMAALTLQLVAGRSLADALAAAKRLLNPQTLGGSEVLAALNKAATLARSDTNPDTAIAKLGGGWTAEEALGIGIYACLRTKSLEAALVMAINHSGDSDTTGAVAGNLAGSMYGVNAIPVRWMEPLELSEVIQRVADDLLDSSGGVTSSHEETLETGKRCERYPVC